MKKLIYTPKQSAHFFTLLWDYFVFLLSPEDSSESCPGRREETFRFGNRFHGAIKIFFWIGFAVFFWIGILSFLKVMS